MSSVDLSDPQISTAYNSLLRNEPLRWFLLAYGNKPNELSLCASGTGDVEELRSRLRVSPGSVCYGIFRERTQNKSLHVSLYYIPDSVRGVWRARALVHGKAVSSKFQAHQVLNASTPEEITVQALRNLLRLPPRDPQNASEATSLGLTKPRSASLPRNPSSDSHSHSLFTSPDAINPPNQTGSAILHKATARSTTLLLTSLPSSSRPLPDSGSESRTPHHDNGTSHSTPSDQFTSYTPPPSALSKTTAPDQPHSITTPIQLSPVTISTTFGSHNVVQNPHTPPYTSWLDEQYPHTPPPVPAKSHPESQHENQTLMERGSENSDGRPPWLQMESIPDSQSVASDASSARAVSPVLPPSIPSQSLAESSSPLPSHRKAAVDGLPGPSLSSPTRTAAEEDGFRSHSKWAANSVESPSTREDTADRLVPQKTYSRFQARAVVARGADEEEERKLADLEEERRRRATERAKREKEVRQEEEMREQEFEARKEREKKRRLESAKKAEERRAEQKRQQAEDERRRKEETERREEETRQRRSHIQRRFEKQTGMDLLTGFVTLESSSSWKRRYFRLSTEDWVFFKNDKEITQPVHAIELSRVRALREWHEGYEELEAIPHSFAVEIKDDQPWLFFADSAEDKEVLLGLLNQAAGL